MRAQSTASILLALTALIGGCTGFERPDRGGDLCEVEAWLNLRAPTVITVAWTTEEPAPGWVEYGLTEDFEGGQLELQAGGQVLTPELRQGSSVLFPAWQRHRVTPVTRGVRDALVLWVVSKRSLR